MADTQHKPSVLIFGGLNTCSRPLATFLVPVEGEPLVSHLRVVDKYTVHPATTYIGPEFTQILSNPIVEYRQLDLTVAAAVAEAYDPKEGQAPYDYVFDFTGEVNLTRPDAIQYSSTYCVAKLLAEEAVKRKVKAYVRIQHPLYETSSKPQEEKDEVKPVGVAGNWWHETLRGLGAIEELNLVILRLGFVYGPYTDFGMITTAITVAAVYGFLKRPMKYMWSPGKHPNNTVHVEDVAGAAWAAAVWMSQTGRKTANEVAGEKIPFLNDKKKITEFENIVPPTETVVAPLFNVVDDANNTLLSIGTTVTSFFGTTFEFFNLVEKAVIKFATDEVEEINEEHVAGWTSMLMQSNPPIHRTVLSPYMNKEALEKRVVGYSNAKLKRVIGYTLKRPQFNHEAIQEIIDKWRAAKQFPNV